MSISKQGVSENIKRAVNNLNSYEDNLKLLQRFEKKEIAIKMLNKLIDKLDINGESDQTIKELLTIKDIIEDIG